MADTQSPPTFSGSQPTGNVPVHVSGPQMSTGLAPAILAVTVVVFLLVAIKFYFLFAAVYRQRRALQQHQELVHRVLRIHMPGGVSGGFPSALKGMSETQIADIPVRKYGEDCEGGVRQEGEDDCPVCLSEFTRGEEVKELVPCCHIFHTACLYKWLRQGDTCPLCRVHLRPPPRYRINSPAPPAHVQEHPVEPTGQVETLVPRVMRVQSVGEGTYGLIGLIDGQGEGDVRSSGRSLSWAAVSHEMSENLVARWRVTLATWSGPPDSSRGTAPGIAADENRRGSGQVSATEGAAGIAADENRPGSGQVSATEGAAGGEREALVDGKSEIAIELAGFEESLSTETEGSRWDGDSDVRAEVDHSLSNQPGEWVAAVGCNRGLDAGTAFPESSARAQNQYSDVECEDIRLGIEEWGESGAVSDYCMQSEGEDWQEIDLEEGLVGQRRGELVRADGRDRCGGFPSRGSQEWGTVFLMT